MQKVSTTSGAWSNVCFVDKQAYDTMLKGLYSITVSCFRAQYSVAGVLDYLKCLCF